ncbi:MAG: hypothetical protein KGS47_04800 [Chloroflexi bacterium]|nr:hypothetical protein [Chloroflexota bacterium]
MLTIGWLTALAACGGTASVGSDCTRRWIQPESESVLDEQRRRGPAWHDRPTLFRAADSTARGPAIDALARFTLDGAPLFFFSPDLRQALVRDDAFGDLLAVDATRLRRGATALIGSVRPAARRSLGDLAILEVLVRSEVIQTYVHIGSELCVADPVGADGAVTIAVRGSHTYATNEVQRDPLHFTLQIDAAGSMAIIGN